MPQQQRQVTEAQREQVQTVDSNNNKTLTVAEKQFVWQKTRKTTGFKKSRFTI